MQLFASIAVLYILLIQHIILNLFFWFKRIVSYYQTNNLLDHKILEGNQVVEILRCLKV